jgi:rod shape-determining protein MreD
MARGMKIEMRVVLVFLLLLAIVLFQMKLMPYFAIGNIKPDLFLLFVCYFSLRNEEVQGALIGFGLGLLEDSLSISPIGVRAVSFSLVGSLLGFVRKGLFWDNPLTQCLLVFSAGILSGLATLLALNFFLIPRPMGDSLFRLILPESIFTALWGLLFFFVFQRWKQRKAR